jgi:16S rRNA (cytosine967-C5)-methyltransferase
VRADPARQAALELLRCVDEDDAYANLVMARILREMRLQARDAGFATELGYGTLRWQGLYDAVLAACISRDWATVDPGLRRILRLGTHQILSMRVPVHAAVDSSCELARGFGSPAAARGRIGFVNAVLRKVAERNVGEWSEHLGVDQPGVDSLSTRWSHPAWIVRAFAEALGPRREELASLLAADNDPARPSLVARPGRLTPAELYAIPGVEPGRWSPYAGTLVSGSVEALPQVRSGAIGVQDEGSQLVALALARAEVSSGEGAWLDLCAGPGGKAALLAGLAQEEGAVMFAVEPHAHRAEMVREVLDPIAGSRVLVADSRTRPWGEQLFDRVLVDAPCTGLGALRRRPEARWRRTPADLSTLGPLQRDLLAAAIAATAPGGVIAYATCSPHLAETEFVVRDLLKKEPGIALEDARELIGEVPDCGDGPFVQLWPHRHGTDGMFLAILRRRG